jgi:hypothetical protein
MRARRFEAMSIYGYANPDDGFAYSPIELSAIDDIEVDVLQTHLQDDSPIAIRWKYFQHASRLPINPYADEDRKTGNLLTRAILAEYENPEPVGSENDDPYNTNDGWTPSS